MSKKSLHFFAFFYLFSSTHFIFFRTPYLFLWARCHLCWMTITIMLAIVGIKPLPSLTKLEVWLTNLWKATIGEAWWGHFTCHHARHHHGCVHKERASVTKKRGWQDAITNLTTNMGLNRMVYVLIFWDKPQITDPFSLNPSQNIPTYIH